MPPSFHFSSQGLRRTPLSSVGGFSFAFFLLEIQCGGGFTNLVSHAVQTSVCVCEWWTSVTWGVKLWSQCCGGGGTACWGIITGQTGKGEAWGHKLAEHVAAATRRAAWGFTSFSCAPHHEAAQPAHNFIHSKCWHSTYFWNSFFFFFFCLFSNTCSAQRKREGWGKGGMESLQRGAVPGTDFWALPWALTG